MDANLKLLKKKRVAHTGSKLPKMTCDEPDLPLDDFVFNIMKDMDKKKNVISYQQLQEFKSQKRQDASPNEDIFSYQNSINSKQTKKMLQKKTFPLMKKCQTSLKHLKKNRCIPKPRAHVGFVPRPQLNPILNNENNKSKFQHGSSSSITKAKHSNKSKSTVSQLNAKVCKTSNFKKYVSKDTVNLKEKAQVQDQLSSSDADDDAFENFVQKTNEKNSDSSDSDSRLIIHRKRSKTKSKQIKKKLKDLRPVKEVNRHVSKITSRPLSDSSESERQETLDIKNKRISFKRRKYSEHESPMRLQEHVPDEATYDSNLSEEDPQEFGDINYDSSDSESNLKVRTSCLPSNNQPQPFDHIELKSCKNIKENKVAHRTVNLDLSNINFDSNLCYSEPAKSVSKCNIPCYVRLIRDPEIDEKAMSFCSIPILPTSNMFYCSDDDCIVISENSDSEEIPEVPKSQTDSTFVTSWSCEDTEPGDSDTTCEIPKQGLYPQSVESNATCGSSSSKPPLSKTTNIDIQPSIQVGLATSVKDSLNQQSLHTETDIDECVIVCEKSKSGASEKIPEMSDSSILDEIANPVTNESPSSEYNAANTIDSEIQDFNVKIVAVHSLTELAEPLIEPSAPESNDVEVIDLSDDDSQMPDIREKSNAAKENIGVSDSLKILEQNESDVQNNESNLPLQCESNPMLLEILSKIDFESIKKAISNIKVENSFNESCQIEENSTSSNLLPPSTSIPTCEKDTSNEINSTKGSVFQKLNTKIDNNKNNQLHNSSQIELTSEKTYCQVGNLNEFPDTLSDSHLVESVKSIAPKYVIDNSVKDFHTSNQTLRKDTDQGWIEVGSSLVNDENRNSLINECATEVLAEVSSENLINETESFQKVTPINPSSLKNRTVENVTGMLPIHSKLNSKNISKQFSETIQNCRDVVCKDLRVTEQLTKASGKKGQLDSSTLTTTSRMTISNKEKVNVSELPDKQCKISEVRNEKSIQNLRIMQPVKKEIVIESPSDELDVLAASYINDLKPSNVKVLSLLDLYKMEYKKYMEIKNTETNVSAGLKLLHDNQVKKLKHLHASIKNLAKHDACFYKVNQEDSCNSAKTRMKNEITDKIDVKEENTENSQELKREGPILPENDVQVATKFNSAGPSKEMVKFMMNIKCAQCGKSATARCQGCAVVYYCSSHCGEQSWRQGHYAVCKKP